MRACSSLPRATRKQPDLVSLHWSKATKTSRSALQALYGAVQAKLGKPAETKRMLGLLSTRTTRELSAADPIHFALLHLSTGDAAKGFSELESAVTLRRTLALRLPGLPQFKQYQDDPRWKAVIAKLLASKPIQ